MSESQSYVTWNEFLGAATLLFFILSAAIGALWGQIKVVIKTIADHRVEVARTYVTTEALVRVEERLNTTINRVADTLGASINNVAVLMEKMIGDIVDLARGKD